MNKIKKFLPSYVNRHGRLTESQKRHIALLKDFDFAKFKSLEVSLSKSNLVLDIGFGNGDYTINYALNYPEKTIIASEVYLSGIGSLIRKIKEESLQNIFIFDGDAREIFENLSDSSVDEINILFPDPWQKARHNKRRLFSEDFLDLIYKKLNKSGKIFVRTDWEDYAETIIESARARSKKYKFEKIKELNFEFKTKFHLKAINEKRKIFTFMLTKK